MFKLLKKSLIILESVNLYIFLISLLSYLTLLAIEVSYRGFVSTYLNLNIFLIITIISGILMALLGEISKKETRTREPKYETRIIDLSRAKPGFNITPRRNKPFSKKKKLPFRELMLAFIIVGALFISAIVFSTVGMNRLDVEEETGPETVLGEEYKEHNETGGEITVQTIAFQDLTKLLMEDIKNSISIMVLNRTGIEGVADDTKKKLEEKGFRILSIGDAEKKDYKSTIIEYNQGKLKEAELVRDSFKNRDQIELKETSDLATDIIVVVGRDNVPEEKLLVIDRSKITIDILNGNGIEGAAAEVQKVLVGEGFQLSEIANADNFNYTKTIVRYKSGQEEAAKIIAKILEKDYTPVLEKSESQGKDIIIILGRKI